MSAGFTAAACGAVAGAVVGSAGYSWLNVGAAVLAFAVVLVAVAAGRRASEADEHLAGVAAGQE